MRSRGWAGSTPASDEEAIARILDAVDEVVAEHGPVIRLADVARKLGVTRQTVYHYFPNAEALLIASAMRAVNEFIDEVADHVNGLNDPVTAVVESIAFAVENLTGDPQLGACAANARRATLPCPSPPTQRSLSACRFSTALMSTGSSMASTPTRSHSSPK
jgi:AcrR family transcriptional regulator